MPRAPQVNRYQIGDQVRLSANFTNATNSPSDPSSINLRIVVGSVDVNMTYPNTTAIVKAGVGSFYYDLDVASPGQFYFRWRGYGDTVAAEYHTIMVHTPPAPFLGS
jgi:hypothetical protein